MRPKSFERINRRLEEGNLRQLSLSKQPIDFYSNDYLGISRKLAALPLHAAGGSTGSRLISGNSHEAEQCEQFLAQFYEAEAALVFNSGYDANIGLFSAIARRGDTLLYDEKIHASVRDGIRLSQARSFSFRHNDVADLKRKLKLAQGDVFVAVEALYSMDGDLAPLLELKQLVQEKSLFLIVDEAHSGGIYGNEGRGRVHALDLQKLVFARLITFGKAYGSHGAVVLGSAELKTYLINFARSFIYTTALPPAQYQNIVEAIQISREKQAWISLEENIEIFRQALGNDALISDHSSPIQIVRGTNLPELQKLYQKMHEAGLGCKIIQTPTVPKGEECIRLCLHAFNSISEMELLIKTIDLQ